MKGHSCILSIDANMSISDISDIYSEGCVRDNFVHGRVNGRGRGRSEGSALEPAGTDGAAAILPRRHKRAAGPVRWAIGVRGGNVGCGGGWVVVAGCVWVVGGVG